MYQIRLVLDNYNIAHAEQNKTKQSPIVIQILKNLKVSCKSKSLII